MTVTYSDGSVEVQTEIREKLGFSALVLSKLEGNSQCSHCSRVDRTNHLFTLLCAAAAVDH